MGQSDIWHYIPSTVSHVPWGLGMYPGNGPWLSTLQDRGFSDSVASKTKTKGSPKDKITVSFSRINPYLFHSFPLAEQRKLKKTDVPLLQRLIQGPSKSNARIFLMDKDAEEISSDVAPYINFHFSFLESILQRLDEEEKIETERIMAKFNTERAFILKCLRSKQPTKTETTV